MKRYEWRGLTRPAPEGYVVRRPWWWWARPFACRCGLHFMAWRMYQDGYTCACGREQLHAENIR